MHLGAGVLRRVPEDDGPPRRPALAAAGRIGRGRDARRPPTEGETMDIGIPREIRLREHRVGLAPSGVRTLVQKGHRVWVESDAGLAAGHPNAEYQAAGAQIAYSRHEVFARGCAGGHGLRAGPARVRAPRAGPGGLRLLGPARGASRGLPRPGGARGDGDRHRGDRGRRGSRTGAPQHVRDRRQPRRDRRQQPAAERVRRQGHPAGRRAGRPARQLRDPRGRRARVRRRARRARARCAGDAARRQRRPPARGRRRAGRRRDDDARDAAERREGAVLRRPRARRGGRPRPARADPRDPRHAAPDEAALGADGPLDRHGRLLRDLAPDVAHEPHATRSTASCTCASRTCRRARRAPRRRR